MLKTKNYVLGTRIDKIKTKSVIRAVSNAIKNNRDCLHIVTVNPEITLLAKDNEHYRITLNKADINTADGMGITIAARIFNFKAHRLTGVDLTEKLLRKAHYRGWNVFLLGSSKETCHMLQQKIVSQYPGIQIAGCEPGIFFQNISDLSESRGHDMLLDRIKKSNPDILFVAFGAPKQELWIHKFVVDQKLARVAIGVGGTFDYLSGRIRRAPKRIRTLGFEWLYRLITQPKRLTRIYKATCVFLYHVLYWRIRMLLFRRKNVLGVIINGKNHILIAQSYAEPDAWKFPQGGQDPHESAEQAILREMSEELGTDKLEIIQKVPRFHKYTWNKNARSKYGYKGQKQTLFILKFTGTQQDINIEKHGELSNTAWVTKDALIQTISNIRKPLAKKVLHELSKLSH